jgi:hypothetical protein
VRHLTGIILALAMSAALFFGACWAVTRIIALRSPGTVLGGPNLLTSVHGVIVVVAVLGTGLLLGILLIAPGVSPLATGLPGLVLLAWSALVLSHSKYAFRYLPLPGTHYAAGLTYLLVNGMMALLGAAMIVPMLVPSRWRRREYYDEDDDEDFSVPAALGLVP